MSVNSVVKAQHGMIGGTIKFEERSLYPTGEFDEPIQDRVHVRGTRFLIGKCSTKLPDRLCACRLNYSGPSVKISKRDTLSVKPIILESI